jgi:hypothetical protein
MPAIFAGDIGERSVAGAVRDRDKPFRVTGGLPCAAFAA